MSRIPYPELTQEQQQALSKNPINLTRMLFHMPDDIRGGMSQMGRYLLWNSPYDAKLRELVILRVGYLSKSAYEEHQHRAYGKKEGLRDDQIEAALAPTLAPPLTDKEQAVLRFTEDVVVNVRPSDKALAEVRQYLSDREVFETLGIIGNYMLIARILETAGVEIDAPGVIVANPDNN